MKIYKIAQNIPTIEALQPYCDDQECYEWAELVAKKFPSLKVDGGFYVDESGRAKDHAWVTAPDGTIFDTTHKQFDKKIPIMIAKVGSEEHCRYHSWNEHHNPDCLHKTLNTGTECDVCGPRGKD